MQTPLFHVHLLEDHTAPYKPLTPVTKECQRSIRCASERPFRPRMDLHINKDTNTVTATFELPGLVAEDVAIEAHQNHLTVSGEFKKADTLEESAYTVRERLQGKFSRTIQLPDGIKPGDITAKMENGLLMITFPLTSPEQQPHRVTIS